MFDYVHAAQCTEPSHAACSPGSPATTQIRLSCSLQQKLVYACGVCGAESRQRRAACLQRASLACLCPCSGAWDEKASVLFCAGSAVGSTSALCGALFGPMRRKGLRLFGRKASFTSRAPVGGHRWGEKRLRLGTCPSWGVGDQRSSCTYFAPSICLAKHLGAS